MDPHGSIFEKREYIENAIKCPCCRNLNWKYHFDQIIRVTLDYDMPDNSEDLTEPALILYCKNKEAAESE
jgi:hypothetical protein